MKTRREQAKRQSPPTCYFITPTTAANHNRPRWFRVPKITIVIPLLLGALFWLAWPTHVARADTWNPVFGEKEYPISEAYRTKASQYLIWETINACTEKFKNRYVDPGVMMTGLTKDGDLESSPEVTGQGGSNDKISCNLPTLIKQRLGTQENFFIKYLQDHLDDISKTCYSGESNNLVKKCVELTGGIKQTAHELAISLGSVEGKGYSGKTKYNEISLNYQYIIDIMSNNRSTFSMSIDKPSWYIIRSGALKHCGSMEGDPLDHTIDTKDDKYVRTDVIENGRAVSRYSEFTYNKDMNKDSKVTIWPNHDETCKDIRENMDKDLDAYISAVNEYLENNEDPSKQPEDGTTHNATGEGGSTSESENPCSAGFFGFGWIFCPGTSILESYLNGFTNWIESSLKWTILSSNNDELTSRWQSFLNIANIVFAIAFIVMIYSMATSTGLSNYDIKKMLPRLIIVAIAVNLSFYICAAMVDLSNITGRGVYKILAGSNDTWSIISNNNILNQTTELILLVGTFLFFGGTVMIALATIYLAVLFRQIALTVLVVISPVAFVCYLLPNTTKWFSKWKDTFIKLLLLYPMFMAVWGGSKWLATLLDATSTGSNDAPFMVNFVCMVVPAIAIIPLFKMSGSLMSTAVGAVAGSTIAQKAKKTMDTGGRRLAKNNPLSRKATGGISSVAGKIASHTKPTGAIGYRARQLANVTGQHSNQRNIGVQGLEKQAEDRAKANIDTMGLTDRQKKDALINGGYNKVNPTTGATKWVDLGDQYSQKALADSVGDQLSIGETKDLMIQSELRSQALEKQHRFSEATTNRQNAAKAIKSSGKSMVNGGTTSNFASGGWRGKSVSDMETEYSIGLAKNLSSKSTQEQSEMSDSQWKHIDDIHRAKSSMSAADQAKANPEWVDADANLFNNAVRINDGSAESLRMQSHMSNQQRSWNHQSQGSPAPGVAPSSGRWK